MAGQSFRADDWVSDTLNRYADMVYRLAYAQVRNRQDAEDIFQEVFLRLVKNRPEFEREEHAKAWLIRVTVNCANSLFRSAWRRRVTVMDQEAMGRLPGREAPEEYADLSQALDRLPPKHRTAIHLFYYEDMPVEAIARALGTKETTVRSWLSRGRKALKRHLTGGEAMEHA